MAFFDVGDVIFEQFRIAYGSTREWTAEIRRPPLRLRGHGPHQYLTHPIAFSSFTLLFAVLY
jgi:hypothetical protein